MESLALGALVGLVIVFIVKKLFVKAVPAADVQALLDAGALLVDVRSPSEFASGSLKGAKSLPMGSPPSTLDKSVPVVVFCASGLRSAKVAQDWSKQGFQVTNLGSMGAGSALKL
jgi:rhodanese-related sulfurtransferase